MEEEKAHSRPRPRPRPHLLEGRTPKPTLRLQPTRTPLLLFKTRRRGRVRLHRLRQPLQPIQQQPMPLPLLPTARGLRMVGGTMVALTLVCLRTLSRLDRSLPVRRMELKPVKLILRRTYFSSPSVTNVSSSDNNFINVCAGQTLTNGLQILNGSCNGIPGVIHPFIS